MQIVCLNFRGAVLLLKIFLDRQVISKIWHNIVDNLEGILLEGPSYDVPECFEAMLSSM